MRRNIRIEQAESSDESDEDEFSANHLDRSRILGNLDNKADIKQEISSGYDIMHRFNQTQKTSFFKRNRKQFPMFGYVEEKARVCF